MTVLPEAVAVSVVIPEVPPKLRVPVARLTSEPAPAKSVATVNEFVFESAIEVVILGMENVPVNVWVFVLNV